MDDTASWHEEWDAKVARGDIDLRTDVPSSARMYDYFLGGKDNFAVDREAAESVIRAYPAMRDSARANRAWQGRAVRFAAAAGVRQFLDIGTGIPTQGHTNEVAHSVAPDARVVYVDNDPIVLTHAEALLAHADGERRTQVMLGDLREPAKILAAARGMLDFDQPVALMLVAIVHFLRDQDEPHDIVRSLVDVLAPGSMLILSHATEDHTSGAEMRGVASVYDEARSSSPFQARSHAEVVELFEGLELVEPGVVQVPFWRPDGEPPAGSDRISLYGGVAVKH